MPKLTRREFLKMAGTSTLGMVAGACAFKGTELLAQSPNLMPEDIVTGRDTWYATLCPQCPAGCGMVVRVVEGRAVKVEGNPLYPLNRGKLCARGQAAVQALYHPDRLLKPLRRIGERGQAQFQEVSWSQALEEAARELSRLRDGGRTERALMISQPWRGSQALLSLRFRESYGNQLMPYDPQDDMLPLAASVRRAFGQEVVPDFDIASAQFILSFGADFLSTWVSPTRYSVGYGEFRQGDRPRGTLVQVEPRFSLTAANADDWVAIKPGAEGTLALSLAQVILEEGLGEPGAAQAFKDLDRYRPEAVEVAVGVAPERIRTLARAFAARRPSLALAGGSAAAHRNGQFNLTAVYLLNYLVGSVGAAGGMHFNPVLSPASRLPVSPFREWQRLTKEMAQGQGPELVLVSGANPVYGLPGSLAFAEALSKTRFIIALASFMDDTVAQADLVLPLHAPLEDWGDDIPDPGPGHLLLGLRQPVVNPVGDTKGFGDIMLELGRRLGLELPWESFRDCLREGVAQLHRQNLGGTGQGLDFEAFWTGLLQQGGWWDETARGEARAVEPALPEAIPTSFDGEAADYPYHFIPFPSHTLFDGRGAHLPWLQATPDPLTTVAWETWAEVGLAIAREEGLKEGDVVAVESSRGTVEAPVYINPMMPPGVVAMPLGQGHRLASTYNQGRGANPFSILAPLEERETGALAWAATRVRVSKAGRKVGFPKFEGRVEPRQLPGAEIIKVFSPDSAEH